MRKRIFVYRIMSIIFSITAGIFLLFGCYAIELNYKWWGVGIIICSMYMILLANHLMTIIAFVCILNEKTEKEEIVNKNNKDGEEQKG